MTAGESTGWDEPLGAVSRRVAVLEAEQAIIALQHRYAWAIDNPAGLDPDAVAACFTSDGEWRSSAYGRTCRGPDEIRDFFTDLRRTVVGSMHNTGQFTIELAPDLRSASYRAYLYCLVLAPGDAIDRAPLATFVATMYFNRCRLVEGLWRFTVVDAFRQYSIAPGPDRAPLG